MNIQKMIIDHERRLPRAKPARTAKGWGAHFPPGKDATHVWVITRAEKSWVARVAAGHEKGGTVPTERVVYPDVPSGDFTSAAEMVEKDPAVLAKLAELRDTLRQLEKKLSEHTSVLNDIWLSAPGCEKCRGRGWVVVWDTLDSLSGCYAEYGPCPNAKCTPETRAKSGLKPGCRNKYDNLKGVPHIAPEVVAEVTAAQGALSQFKRDLDLLRDLAPRPGDLVKTTKALRGSGIDEGVLGWVMTRERNRAHVKFPAKNVWTWTQHLSPVLGQYAF